MTTTAQKVKEELARRRSSRRCCQLAELSALIHMEGTYRIRGKERHYLVTESSDVLTARKIYTLMHALFPVETPMVKVQKSSPRKENVYRLEVPDQAGFHQMLYELGVLDSSLTPGQSIPGRLTRNPCCVAPTLRGAFLGGGYISEPFGPADFEISFSSRTAAILIKDLFARKSLEPALRVRRGQTVLYLKRRQAISEFLAITGAHSAHLDWESQTIINSTKNAVNRLVNCDTANARRLAEASLMQQEMINVLRDEGIIDSADPALVQLAEARLKNPQAALSELGVLLVPPVSKAVVQGRMRRLFSLLPDDILFEYRKI